MEFFVPRSGRPILSWFSPPDTHHTAFACIYMIRTHHTLFVCNLSYHTGMHTYIHMYNAQNQNFGCICIIICHHVKEWPSFLLVAAGLFSQIDDYIFVVLSLYNSCYGNSGRSWDRSRSDECKHGSGFYSKISARSAML